MASDVPSAFSIDAVRDMVQDLATVPDANAEARSRTETVIAFAIAVLTILFVSVVGVLMALA
jgi:hypothetical protein